jgi:hypothetical protein
MVMEAPTTTFSIFSRITALFCNNQQTRAGYLSQKFSNLEQKAAADALTDVSAPVADDALVWNTIKGLDEKYEGVAALAPQLTPFPTFM